MNSFVTKYIVAVIVVVILMIAFNNSDIIISFNNVLGMIGLLAGIEAMSELLKK